MIRISGLLVTCCVLSIPVLAAQADQQGGPRRDGFGARGERVQGTVTSATADKVTIKTEAGDTYEITPAPDARIIKDRQPIKLSDIKSGDSITAMGQVDATKKTVQAMGIMDIDAATVAKAKENLGKTYIAGRVTAVDADNLKITVTRSDNISQVIAVDEGTSFQRGMRGVAADVAAAGGMMGGGGRGMGMGGGMGMGRRGGGEAGAPASPESITLADIKPGEMIMATGSVKNGTFTVQKMGVMEPGAGRRGGMAGEGASGSPAPPPQQ
jgi:Cu/Ag efflux protein CusF